MEAHRAASQAQVGGLRMADLPTAADALQQPGSKDGATKVVNNNGRMEAHTVRRGSTCAHRVFVTWWGGVVVGWRDRVA